MLQINSNNNIWKDTAFNLVQLTNLIGEGEYNKKQIYNMQDDWRKVAYILQLFNMELYHHDLRGHPDFKNTTSNDMLHPDYEPFEEFEKRDNDSIYICYTDASAKFGKCASAYVILKENSLDEYDLQ